MTRWINKFANHLKSSSNSDTTRYVKFRGKHLFIETIEKVWCSRLCGINVIRTSKGTNEHFNKHVYNRMRFYFITQLLSNHVIELMDDYAKKYTIL